MFKMLNLLSGWQGYAAAAVLAAILASGTTFYFTSLSYRLTISKMETEKATETAQAANKALEDFTANAEKIAGAADTFLAVKSTLDNRFASINRNLSNAIQNSPLPADCKPDHDRVQSLSAAIAAANSASGSGAVPAVSPAK